MIQGAKKIIKSTSQWTIFRDNTIYHQPKQKSYRTGCPAVLVDYNQRIYSTLPRTPLGVLGCPRDVLDDLTIMCLM